MVRVCVVGCLHGELDKVYADIESMDQQTGKKTQLVLCCGDFQSVRNPADLHAMSVPPKYYQMGDFYRYYSEEMTAPIPTVFVGGNHEASSYLQELPYGGWVAPNIWYMGYAGVVQFAGLRIAGLSGIYKLHDYSLGHFEHPPYTDSTKRSVYHVRNLEVFRLGQLNRRVDIMLSHDWPRGIYHYGDKKGLLSRKRHFKEEVASNTLGSPPAEQLLCRLRPRFWFAAHLHCKFAAVVEHQDRRGRHTKFLALDKCLPSRDYLQFLDIEPDPSYATFTEEGRIEDGDDHEAPVIVSLPSKTTDDDDNDEPALTLDPEWMCILRSTNEFLSLTQIPCMLPGQNGTDVQSYAASVADMESLWDPFMGVFRIPQNFERTAPAYKPDDTTLHNKRRQQLAALALKDAQAQKQPFFSNPQTELLCAMLELTNPNAALMGKESYNVVELASRTLADEDDDDDDAVRSEDDGPTSTPTAEYEPSPPKSGRVVPNPEEIDLGELDDDGDPIAGQTGAAGAHEADNEYNPELVVSNPGQVFEDVKEVYVPTDDLQEAEGAETVEYNPQPVVKNPEVIDIDYLDDVDEEASCPETYEPYPLVGDNQVSYNPEPFSGEIVNPGNEYTP
ncbi:unnamed protein product [Mesocestoides corti]|uniref:DBR1 domain-containing protein n=1 Tax=Mesocestoides corti TaxID=53468 RepID=A0A0R3ULY3_MESCO|nr:unnamed protein product [Mesocestoides corti]